MSHTPGPWTVLGGHDVCPDVKGLGMLVPIAKCTERRVGPFRISKQEADANARLIAAAPDLLAACVAVDASLTKIASLSELDKLDIVGTARLQREWEAALAAIRAAIERAGGVAS